MKLLAWAEQDGDRLLLVTTVERTGFLWWAKTVVHETLYRGSSTVWHSYPLAQRPGAFVESRLSDINEYINWGKANGLRVGVKEIEARANR